MSFRGLSGQSAIEYLMTYGWMLLVVAIVGGAIFATVGNQNIESTTGFDGDVTIDDFGVSDQDELGLEVRDGSGQGITVSRVNVSDPDTGQWIYKEFTGENRVGVGSSKIFELPNVTQSGSGDELEVEVIYNSEGLSNLSEEGTINGQLELNNTGSFEGLPEDDHQSTDSLEVTKTYGFGSSYDVDVNESGTPENVTEDVSDYSEIEVVMNGAGAGNSDEGYSGGSGGFVNATFDVSSRDQLRIWVGHGGNEFDTSSVYGRNYGGAAAGASGSGGGSTEINADGNFLAAADGGGGAANSNFGGGGGGRGGTGGTGYTGGAGGEDGEGSGYGGDGVDHGGTSEGQPGGQEINSTLSINEYDGSDSTNRGGGSPSETSGNITITFVP